LKFAGCYVLSDFPNVAWCGEMKRASHAKQNLANRHVGPILHYAALIAVSVYVVYFRINPTDADVDQSYQHCFLRCQSTGPLVRSCPLTVCGAMPSSRETGAGADGTFMNEKSASAAGAADPRWYLQVKRFPRGRWISAGKFQAKRPRPPNPRPQTQAKRDPLGLGQITEDALIEAQKAVSSLTTSEDESDESNGRRLAALALLSGGLVGFGLGRFSASDSDSPGAGPYPLFVGNLPLAVGECVRLKLFEPRYKWMCRELMLGPKPYYVGFVETPFPAAPGNYGVLCEMRDAEGRREIGENFDGTFDVSVCALSEFVLTRVYSEPVPSAGNRDFPPLKVGYVDFAPTSSSKIEIRITDDR